MDLVNIPKHVWWIITPFIIVPLSYLIVMMGYLLYTYAQILPGAKNITVKMPNIEIATELVNKQILVNEQLQNTVTSTQALIENTISHNSESSDASTPLPPEPLQQLKDKAAKLQLQQEQLKIIKNDLINVKATIQMYEQPKGVMDDQKPYLPNLQK